MQATPEHDCEKITTILLDMCQLMQTRLPCEVGAVSSACAIRSCYEAFTWHAAHWICFWSGCYLLPVWVALLSIPYPQSDFHWVRTRTKSLNAGTCTELSRTTYLACTSMAQGTRQKAEGKRQKAEGRRQKAEGRRQKAEGRRQKAEGRRQKAKGRRQKTKGKRQKAGTWQLTWSLYCTK